jgi:D-aminopeptidase
MRLRDLNITIGPLPTGPNNALTDVAGVGVGHANLHDNGLHTGLTAVVPYPVAIKQRRLFIGHYALDGGDALTGLGVAEDFGTFSTPIVLAPAPAVGRLYDALIGYGLNRDPGLSTYTGWPPLVVGINDTALNPPATTYQHITPAHLAQALEDAATATVAEGNAGIGGGLIAFGAKGGTGTASRLVETSATYTIGALVAANGGEPSTLCIDRFPLSPLLDLHPASTATARTFAAVVATDAPLIPRQLSRLAGRAALGLARTGLIDATTHEGLVLAFSTNGIVAALDEDAPTEPVQSLGEAPLHTLFGAAADACEEAVFNALLAATPIEREQRSIAALSHSNWPEAVRRYQQNKQHSRHR